MRILYFLTLFLIPLTVMPQSIFVVSEGQVNFTSDAPLELIEASSDELEGLIRLEDRSFLFRVPMKSFEGFNSSLQQTHFNENYVESDKYPYTIFEGKIIEELDFSETGTYTVRGKGKFVCHGVEQERIIKSRLTISANALEVESEFTVFLDDHNIKIPAVVNQKIAEEILVEVTMELKRK